jgi:type I restriction enzyme, S subunit
MSDSINELLEKHFDIALYAPEGIQRLREIILTLGMQGKLVPQDLQDEQASELLKKIDSEKKRLVKEGKIKEQKPLPEIMPGKAPYQIPKSWEWVCFGYIAQHNSGKTLDSGRKAENYVNT